jgi:hypothetical protein
VKCRVSRILFGFSIGLFALGIPSAEAEEPFDTVTSYTKALQAGDTIAVKSYIGGHLYETREVLLDQNEEYPDFLRSRYGEAVFHISDELIDMGAQGQGVAIEVSFPAGHTSKSIAIVEQAPNGAWMIVDEVKAIH